MSILGSLPERQEFFRSVAKPQDRFQDRASALLMAGRGVESCLKESYDGVMKPVNPVPTFYVDFNEMVDRDLVLLSKGDTEIAADGRSVSLYEGMPVRVYDNDADEVGPNNLVATGYAELNRDTGWSAHVKWCCRIDNNGIRHEIERPN